MLTRKFVIYLLVFLTTTIGITFPKPSSNCEDQVIEKDQLDINAIPLNYRNSYENNQKNKPMLIELEVDKDVKKCLNHERFNLTISLDETIPDHGELKVGSTATPHIVKIGRQSLEIESCDDSSDNRKKEERKDEEKFLKNLKKSLGLASKGKNLETIYFTAPSQIWDIKDKVVNITVTFDESKKKRSCDYRECSEISFFS